MSASNISNPNASPALHRFALVAAGATFILIFVGGLVTSTGSGLSVPDWPLAFGHLIPKLVDGVRFEWSHRVVAGIVVILTLILALWIYWVEPRRWVRNTALFAFGMVIFQAILGAMNVLLLLPLAVAVAHSATAQAFFCVMVAIAMFTNPKFGTHPKIRTDYARPRLAVLATITTAVIYGQVIIGAVMRNLGAGLAIPDFPLSFGHLIPPFISVYVDINFAHRCGALVVTFFVIWLAARIFRYYRDEPLLRHLAIGLIVLLVIQITLGALTIWSGRAVIPTTAHVAGGAAVLATSFALTIRSFVFGGLAAAPEAANVHGLASDAINHKVTA